MVLSTDMAVHFDLLKTFAKAVEMQPSPKEWNPQTLSLVFQMLVHLADLANPSRPFFLALKWAERVITEFMNQVWGAYYNYRILNNKEGRLPHIALFSSLHGDMTRPVGRPRHTWEKCVCADLKVLGQDEGSWEASCQIKSAWRKRLWDRTHPWESQRLVRCRRRTKQAIDKHVERYVVPFSGWEDGGSPVPRWWEPPPAPTRVVLDPAASPPPMCDGSGAGFGF